MTGNLKNQFYKEMYGKILKQKKIFNLNFSNELIEKLSLKMNEIQYAPG